jgi:hypothetical protein
MLTNRTRLIPWLPALSAAVLIAAFGCSSSTTSTSDAPVKKSEQAVAARPDAVEPKPALLPEDAALPLEPPHSPEAVDASLPDATSMSEAEAQAPLPGLSDGGGDPPAAEPGAQPGSGINPLRVDAPAGQDPPQEPAEESAPQGRATRLGKNRDPFDPIKENGEYFADWPPPKLAIVISGRQDGYLEPCGCAGKDRMKGGLMRRYSLFEELRSKRGWPTVGLDVGGLIKGFGRQAEMKFMATVEALRMMKYDAVALGANDLKLPADQLFSVVADTEALPSLFVSANVGVFGFAHGMSARQRVIERGGLRIGITSVLGKEYQEEIHNTDVEIVDPEAALAELLPAMEEKCDLMILLAHATTEESEALAKKYPRFDIVVTAGGPPEPPPKAATVEGTRTMLVEVGTKGMAAIVLGIYDGLRPEQPEIRCQRVIIDSRYPDSPQVKALFAAYQDQLREAGLSGLGIRPAPHPAAETLGRFVGSEKCQSCHEESYDVWKKSGHSDAWKTLAGADPPRNFDPECIACHVIGWNTTYYFPYEGGFLNEAKTPELVDVGCESCHGPGEAHLRAEMGSDKEEQKKFQEASVLTLEDAKDRFCGGCHDLDNSPDFNFDTYWPLVEHHEDLGDEEEK